MTDHWNTPPKVVIVAQSCMLATYLARDLGIVGKTIDVSPQSIRNGGALRGICGVTTAVIVDECADEATLDAVRLTMLDTGGQILRLSRIADAHAPSSP